MEQLILPLFIVAIAAMMFFSMRKQKRVQQQQQDMQNSIGVGDRVMTTSGLYGTVVETGENTIHLEIADGVQTEWLRLAIREKVADDTAESEDTDELTEDGVSDEIVEPATVDDTRTTETDTVGGVAKEKVGKENNAG